MPSCCSPFECTANQQFDRKKVAQELKRYRAKGPGPTTRLLEDDIARSGALTGTVLDIGSGLGVLALALLERGARNAIAVDASSAYIEAAREEAARRGRTDTIQFVHADFVSAAPQVPAADVVTLDRVVCCYPFFDQLLDRAVKHAQRCIALSYPRDVWYVRLGITIENGMRWIRRNPFRTFAHPVRTMEELITQAGFQLSSRRKTSMWSVDVYSRRDANPAGSA